MSINNYIKSFLSGRKIITKIENSFSSTKNIDIGIPQGSIITPILFNIMIHDLPKSTSHNINTAQHADDL